MAAPQVETQPQRIENNCKTIFGCHCGYEFDTETDTGEDEYWQIYVRSSDDYRVVWMSNIYMSEEAAWRELDIDLEMAARQKKHGVPKTKEEVERMRKEVTEYLGYKKE